jgi:hypothetical protein
MDRPVELQLRCDMTAAVWWQMLFDAEVKEIVTVYCEVHAKHENAHTGGADKSLARPPGRLLIKFTS